MKNNVINAFDCVSKIYEETSFMLKDFTEIISNHKYELITGENTIGYVSKKIDYYQYWLARYCSLFFKLQDQQETYPLLSITAGFYNLESKSVEPYLILGVVEGMEHEKASWDYWWLFSPFFNEKDVFDYVNYETHEILESAPGINRNPVKFKCRYTNDSYNWPKKGVFFSEPLLSVSSHKDIESLAQETIHLWNDYV